MKTGMLRSKRESEEYGVIDLAESRSKLDVIDKQIVELMRQRMEISKDVAEYKIANNKAVYDKTRENEKLKTLCALVEDEFDKKCVDELFKQIMAMSRKLQYGILEAGEHSKAAPHVAVKELEKDGCRVVYQGVPGAYSHAATLKYFGENADCSCVPTFRAAMEAIKNGEADYAVLPLDNSTAGIVNDTYDLLREYDNYIVAEETVKIEHALVGIPGTDISKVKRVYSHAQGLMQCAKFLEDKGWQQLGAPNTAVAAKKILDDKDSTQVAIASETAAKLYGLEILASHINTSGVNTTRFVIVSKNRIVTEDADKVSICFEIPHEAGSLYSILSNLMFNGLNMTKIESRPISERKWEFMFYVDFGGHISDAAVKNALRGIEEEAIAIKLLGNYKGRD
jgi:chorismate mutase/prephenate dehydratase